MEKKKPGFWDELEENVMLIPMGISLVLMLATFLMQFFASPEAVTVVQQMSFYAYAWLASLALSVCARDNIHLRVPVLEQYLPDQAKKIEHLINDILALIVLVVMLIFTFQLATQTAAQGVTDPKAPGLPMIIAYASPVIGYLAAAIRTAVRMMKGGK